MFFPSGYLHIGHAKAALLSDYFARQYNGTLRLRLDDTNPSKEKEEFQDAIIEDLRLMGIKPDKMSFTSDYFDYLYDMALRLIKEGGAYADDTDQETMRDERFKGIASKRRERTVEETLRIFEEMKNATPEGVKNCIRAKISYDDNNKTLRDPVIYRYGYFRIPDFITECTDDSVESTSKQLIIEPARHGKYTRPTILLALLLTAMKESPMPCAPPSRSASILSSLAAMTDMIAKDTLIATHNINGS